MNPWIILFIVLETVILAGFILGAVVRYLRKSWEEDRRYHEGRVRELVARGMSLDEAISVERDALPGTIWPRHRAPPMPPVKPPRQPCPCCEGNLK
jgi:hypothetical protein